MCVCALGLGKLTKVFSLSLSLSLFLVFFSVCCKGWVKTDMTSHNGLIDDVTSVKGMISVLEEQPELNGKFFDYKHEAIPW